MYLVAYHAVIIIRAILILLVGLLTYEITMRGDDCPGRPSKPLGGFENTHALNHDHVLFLALRLVSKGPEVCNQRMPG